MDWVKLDCPRCKTVSPIPASQAGQYVVCPGCQKSVMAPLHAPATAPPVDQAAAPNQAAPPRPPASGGVPSPPANYPAAQRPASAVAAPPVAAAPRAAPRRAARPAGSRPIPIAPSNGAPPVQLPIPGPSAGPPAAPGSAGVAAPLRGVPPGGAPPRGGPIAPPRGGSIAPPSGGPIAAPPSHQQLVAAPQRPAAAPPPPANVARFLTPDLIPSTVSLAADGQLPKLALTDTAKPVEQRGEGSSFNPLVLFAGVAVSLCLSVVLLMSDFESGAGDARGDQLRQQLTLYYKGVREPLAPYQVHLREAQQAYSRGQIAVSQAHYRKVLDMLRAEGRSRFRGLTGAPASDKALEEVLARLLDQNYVPEPSDESQ